ncbi:hypothetical protein CHS0354_035441 [Potamilus streckersoni]|uniref:Ubiquitin carboxyl-terminal hydrolase 47 n=1 Tax=Potamilus streckersoni TaxID=2493646 RepID=A0AAE0TDV1_9BIVA|nr:hypothetical protein CHS0354_035441 [Potamilus streckersoni]
MVTGENTQLIPTEDVCVADGEKVLCIIRDMVDTQCHGVKHSLNLPATVLVSEFIQEVAKQFGYMAHTINLQYERQVEGGQIEVMTLDHSEDRALGEICVHGIRRHTFVINEMEGQLPQKVEAVSSGNNENQASGTSSCFNYSTEESTKPSISSTSFNSTEYSYSSALIKSETGYVGLVNQAMTCYLNSLLQTLYMTPEFRNALYRWEFDGTEEEAVKSIPSQLQKLFLQLQTSKKRAAETTDLTRSFGWDSGEVWQQHDVQELCRVMFDALEVKWKNTDQANLINQLYQGKMKDYVKCLECGHESARVDAYLDIPLVIRPFGSNQSYSSVDEALRAFVQPEILDDSNQYFCEQCNKKCNAHKGFKFVSFPYLLTLQLKRFDFDYSTMHRIKLNDRMSFPELLNLKHLIDDETETHKSDSAKPETKMMSPTTNGLVSEEDVDEGIEVETCACGTSYNGSSDDFSGVSSNEALVNVKNMRESDVSGPYTYELFSIMIHSGSAAGGHYYAYIKCLSDGQWYSFNDQHVTKITYEDIRKTYGGSGGSRGYYSSTYASSTNAYMLMYRKIDKERNACLMKEDEFPEHLKKELQKINDREEAERKQKELEKSTCKIKVFCYHPTQRRRLDHKLEIHKDKTLAEATEMARSVFDLEDVVPLDCVRLVKYDEYQDTLERSFESEEETLIGKLLGGVKQSYCFDLLLETKRQDQIFHEYKPGGVTVKVYLADLKKDIIHDPVNVRAYHVQTVQEFKCLVSQVLNIPETNMRCVLERFHSDLRLLSIPNKTLKTEGFFKSNKVYVECSGDQHDNSVPFQESRLYKLLDRHQNTFRVHITLPSIAEIEEWKRLCSHSTIYSKTGLDSALESGINSSDNSVGNSNEVCNDGNDSLEVDEGISDKSDRSDSDIDFRFRTLSLQRGLSQSDPSVYHSCQQAERNSSLSPQGSDERTSSPLAQSMSSQSTSTSAEFSLSANLNSNCDGNFDSPEEFHLLQEGGQDVSEHICGNDSDQHEKTLPPSPLQSREMDFKEPIQCSENWEAETSDLIPQGKDSEGEEVLEEIKRYFLAEPIETNFLGQRSMTVYVDKRILLSAFKKELEPHIGLTSENFKVYRVYANSQEFESTRLSDTLSFLEDGKINIKLGRALRNGEYRVKIYQLLVNEAEPSKFLLEAIFAKGMTVLESKKMIFPDLRLQHGLDIPLDRCRLRKKTWKNPGAIYLNNQTYEEDIQIFPNWDVFLEVLDEPEKMLSNSQLAVYIRRWMPSKYQLDPFQEVILQLQTVDELKEKISEKSGIPVEDIEIAKGRGTFPYEVSLLEIHTDLDWNPPVTSLSMWPLYICDDGCLVYYRDRKEELLEISEEMKKDIQQKENARMNKLNQRVNYSPRKEKALKIYTEDTPVTSSKVSPDLD